MPALPELQQARGRVSVPPPDGGVQVLPEVPVRGQVHVRAPRDHVQVRGCVQPNELRLQTLKTPTANDAVQPAGADAANADAHDALAILKKLPAVS